MGYGRNAIADPTERDVDALERFDCDSIARRKSPRWADARHVQADQ